jgi:hypothetical protein
MLLNAKWRCGSQRAPPHNRYMCLEQGASARCEKHDRTCIIRTMVDLFVGR